MTVSRGRQLLAWYIDFLIFASIWALAGYVANFGHDFLLSVLIFFPVRYFLGMFVGMPGSYLLSIETDRSVDDDVLERENWLTILVGLLFLLEGTKRLVRWTEFDQGFPFFGFIPDPAMQIATGLVFGLVYILAGALILKVHRSGFWLANFLFVFEAASILVIWKLWDAAITGIVVARREFQELPVRAGEIEFMQWFLPEALLFALVAGFIILLGNAGRFAPR
jgi:hypothetical protein